MKITLIEPPIVRPKDETVGIECEIPMALCTLAASLMRRGHEVRIIDAMAEGYHARMERPDGNVYIGLTFEQILGRIKEFGAEAVGISSIFYFNLPTVIGLTEYIKERLPEVKVILGGIAPTMLYQKLMESTKADFIVLREGDYSLPGLLENMDNPASVPDVVWREGGSIKASSGAPLPGSLDDLPFPDRELVDLELYMKIGKPFGFVKEKKRFTTILTSRGCPFACTFCSAQNVHGRLFRYRSAENVLAEIEVLVEKHGITELHVIDENFTLNRPRAMTIMNGLIERGYHKFLSWTCPNGLFIKSLDEELVDKMQESNCHSIALAVESGDKAVSKNLVKKPIDHAHVEKIVRYLREHTDIMLCGFFIIGFPGETKEQIISTLNFANRLKLHNATISMLMPYPFTEAYDMAVRNNQLVVDGNEEYYHNLLPKHGAISTNEFTPSWLKAIQETDRFLALHRKRRKSLWTLTTELVPRNGWTAPKVAMMIMYHAMKGDISGR